MKNAWAFLLVFGVAGCGVELLTTAAIQGELQAQNLTAAKRQMGYAAEQTAKVNIRRAIDTYRAETGENPPTLEALVPNYLPRLPVKADGSPYFYDRATGTLVDEPVESVEGAGRTGVTAEDERNMAMLRQAITLFGQRTRFYPATLETLVQNNYLQFVPLTSSGKAFLYNAQNGALEHPARVNANVPSVHRGEGMAGGAGPLGETLTGLSMRNQLGHMNNAGVSSAGGAARRGLGGTTNRYNQRQSQAIRDLGL